MAKKTTTKSKPEVSAKRAAKPAEKPKAAATVPPKEAPAPTPAPAPAPVESKPPKTVVKAKRVVKDAAPKPRKAATPKPPAYTQNDVALRAYFISEKRRAEGLPGDEHQDWLEAERQIIVESSKKKPKKKA